MTDKTRPRRLVTTVIRVLGFALLMVPVSMFVTIMLMPVWEIIERTLGIEAIGHSGPSEWCFHLVYVLLLSVGLFWAWRRSRGH